MFTLPPPTSGDALPTGLHILKVSQYLINSTQRDLRGICPEVAEALHYLWLAQRRLPKDAPVADLIATAIQIAEEVNEAPNTPSLSDRVAVLEQAVNTLCARQS